MNDLTYEAGDNAPPRPTPLSIEQVNEYLDYIGEQLIRRRGQVVGALEAQARAYPAIEDDDALGEVMVNIAAAAALGKVAEGRRTETKKPFRAAGDAVDAWFKKFALPLQDAMAPIQQRMNAYGALKLARQRAIDAENRRVAEAEARRLAAIASQRIASGKEAGAALDRAASAAAALETAEASMGQRASKLTQTRSLYGAVASVRETWGWEVMDFSEVPRSFLQVNPEAIKEVAKARDSTGKPTATIPGIKWVVKTAMGVR